MRARFAAVILLFLLPATATVAAEVVPSSDAEYCRHATPDEPYVFQAGCWKGSIYCNPWVSTWDEEQGQATSICTM